MLPQKIRWPHLLAISAVIVVFGIAAAIHFAIGTLKERVEKALGPHGEVKEIRVALTGVEILDLRIKAPTGSPAAAAWPSVDQLRAGRILVVPSYMDLLVGKLTIETLRVEHATLSMLRTREGKMHVLPSLLDPQAKLPHEANARDADAGAPPALFINRVELIDGAIDFFDASVRTPPHALRLEKINAAVGRLRLPALTGISTFDLAGTLKGVKQDGKVSINGTIEFATRESGLSTRLRGVDLLTLQPYLLKATEAGVKSGTLDLDLNSSVKKGLLHAPGTLTLKNLELSSTGGTLMGMPRNAVVAAMKRRDGSITLRFVLEGDIQDPHFSLNESLSKRLASSLASALGVSIEELARGVGKLGGSAAKGIGDSFGKLLGR